MARVACGLDLEDQERYDSFFKYPNGLRHIEILFEMVKVTLLAFSSATEIITKVYRTVYCILSLSPSDYWFQPIKLGGGRRYSTSKIDQWPHRGSRVRPELRHFVRAHR